MEYDYRIYDITLPQIRLLCRNGVHDFLFRDLLEAIVSSGVHTVEVPVPFLEGDFNLTNTIEYAVRMPCVISGHADVCTNIPRVSGLVVNIVLAAGGRDSVSTISCFPRAEVIRAICQNIEAGRNVTETVQFTLQDATYVEPVFLRQCIETALQAGARRVHLAGFPSNDVTQERYAELVKDVLRFFGKGLFLSVTPECLTQSFLQHFAGRIEQVETSFIRNEFSANSREVDDSGRTPTPAFNCSLRLDPLAVSQVKRLVENLLDVAAIEKPVCFAGTDLQHVPFSANVWKWSTFCEVAAML